MPEIYIIRHCEAKGQAPDASLTERGYQQAQALTRLPVLQDLDSIVTSPYERAYRTVQPLAEQLGLEIKTDERLIERVLCGEDSSQWRDRLRRTYEDHELCYPGGESSRAATERAIRVINELQEQGYHRPAIVSHGNLISLLLGSWDRQFGFTEWEAMTNPDLYHVTLDHPVPVIRRLPV
ncbi:histidine phosphatase family protein [Paenibacillus bovis]|uniref:Phosphoglycerate mutase n=1 Tax=Paenibacillus bovis TaxID=1616788 RepID=A0A172ZGJ9_9BACL|nr:histidine phosphatase family protein [Paenibacillus bovis]ANF96659.1 phosphoglycerate mutase [Paenibacillus bovis]